MAAAAASFLPSAFSPPKYRAGPRVPNAQTPSRTASTAGQNPVTSAMTGRGMNEHAGLQVVRAG